jgi:AhpD family alkylhydroperoxidase
MTQSRLTYEDFSRVAPAARVLGKAVDESGLDRTLPESVKVRASQPNGCAFCLQFHLAISRELGVPEEKLDPVATRHAEIFSDREAAFLGRNAHPRFPSTGRGIQTTPLRESTSAKRR